MPRLLSDSQIAARLKALRGWRREGQFITKSFEFPTFMEGVAFVNRVAAVAESEEHHPDIHVGYPTLTLSVQPHSEGGVTEWDCELAAAIERDLTKRR